MSQTPSIGRIVHYQGPGTADAEKAGKFAPQVYPATITKVHNPTCVNLFVMTDVGHMNLHSVVFGSPGEGGTWFWPPYVPAAASPAKAAPEAPRVDLTSLARFGYQAYASASGGKNFQGNPMPTWDELPETIRDYWRAAARVLSGQVPAEPLAQSGA